MDSSSRRDFLKKTAVGGAAATASLATMGLHPRRIQAQAGSGFERIVYRKLGSTGFLTSEVGMGCMNMRDPELVHAAIDTGINYIDTAHSYMNGANEEVVGQVMKTKRDQVFLTTKLRTDNPAEFPSMMEASLKRLQTDHVDLVLLHVVDTREQALNAEVMQVFDTMRTKGMTRFIGISTHSNQAEVLDAAVESKHWQAVLVGYNYFSPPEVTDAIQRTREAGIATIGMKNLITSDRPRKPFPDIRADKSGKYTNEQALLKWVLDNRFIDTTIPGMTTFEQLAQDVDIMGMKLSFEDRDTVRKYGELKQDHYCQGVSGCTGCKDQCPSGVCVNEINRCLNYAEGYGDTGLAWENYRALPKSSRLDACNDCDECVVKCVNGLDLPAKIRAARSLFA